jgi:hypothetical protein
MQPVADGLLVLLGTFALLGRVQNGRYLRPVIGLITKVRRLFMFHHDPLHTDAKLEAMLVRAEELWGDEQNGLALSFEGMEIEVT